jgi:hypothetical protein
LSAAIVLKLKAAIESPIGDPRPTTWNQRQSNIEEKFVPLASGLSHVCGIRGAHPRTIYVPINWCFCLRADASASDIFLGLPRHPHHMPTYKQTVAFGGSHCPPSTSTSTVKRLCGSTKSVIGTQALQDLNDATALEWSLVYTSWGSH